MSKVIVFDFFYTLFDPQKGELYPAALSVLDDAKRKGYTLVLLSQFSASRRHVITELGIEPYFAEIALVEQKNKQLFSDIAKRYDADLSASFTIGDRAQSEVWFGHQAGWRTVWVRSGVFVHEKPQGYTPDYQISELKEVLAII